MIIREYSAIERARCYCTGIGFVGTTEDPNRAADDYESYAKPRATGGCRMTRKDIRELCRGRNRALNACRMSLRTHRDGACADKTAWMKTERRRPSIKLKVYRTPSGAVGLIG